ncbi:hypothetical protein MASR1M107_17100 [Ignavibacteriales bacterium]
MKKSIYYFSIFFAVCAIVYGGIQYSTGIPGNTRLNGDGCVCHNPESSSTVFVRIWGPNQVTPGSTNNYTVSLKGGPAVKGGFNVAARFGTLSTTDAGAQKIGAELTHNTPRIFGSADSVSWTFKYTAPNTPGNDTIYAVGNSVNGDGNPSDLDNWNFSPNFPVQISQVVPVELTSFSASRRINGVELSWTTATELNNRGFEIEKNTFGSWQTIGMVKGNGTTTNINKYTFTDNSVEFGKILYRLKQIDYSGQFEYSNVVEVEVESINGYALEQNYPNPFNPSTVINFSLPSAGNVVLVVYNSVGEKVATLVNGALSAGSHSVRFKGDNLPSGLYFYKLQADGISFTRKMVLSK